ncbi:MAG: hypothetical protein IJ934_03310 [Acetobacter sp.]|nr:hypothetical protein [Acetobacter sp.]
MNAFREKRQKNPSLEPVCFEVEWPIRLMQKQEKAQFGLPENARITIVDLPGLNSLHDDHNRQVIMQYITKALCLIVCNAYDINNETEKKLIQDIVQSVIQLQTASSSVNRMLFIPNRIDAFFKSHNDNNVDALDRFKRRIKEQVCESLRERLPEENESINAIKFDAQICSEPALFAVNAQRAQTLEKKIEYIRNIKKHYSVLFGDDYWEEEVGSIKNLDDSQCDAIIKKTLECSFADDFLRHLKDHITHNLSEIIIGGARIQLYESFVKLRSALDQSLFAHMKWTKEQIDQKKKRLNFVCQGILKEAEPYKKLLKDIEEKIQETKQRTETQNNKNSYWLKSLGHVCKVLEDFIGQPNLLSPLRKLHHDVLIKPIKMLDDYFVHVLNSKNKEEFPDQELTTFPSFDQFSTSLENFSKLFPDKNILLKGGFLQNKDGSSRKIQSAILDLQKAVSITLNEVIQDSVLVSSYRLQDSFQKCQTQLLTKFQETCREKFKEELKEFAGLKDIFISDKMLPQLRLKISISFEFPETEQVVERLRGGLGILDFLLGPKKIKESGIKTSSIPQILEKQVLENENILKYFEDYIVSFVEHFSQFLDTRIKENVAKYKNILMKKDESYEQESKETEQNVQKYKDILSKMDFDLPQL